MGVVTTFSERRNDAKEALKKVIENLQECVKEDTWGYSDIREDYIDDLIQMIAQLTIMKRKL